MAVLALMAAAASPLWAYHIALKDGRIIEFKNYRVTEKTLFYVNGQDREVSIALSLVDLDRTAQLNASENPSLDLPGLVHPPHPSESDNQPTLGDIARGLRKKDATSTSKQVLTNDDVAPAPFSTGTSSGGTASDNQTIMGKFFDLDRVTLGQAILRMAEIDVNTPFPERSDWEFSLFDAKQDMVRESIQAKAHPNDVQEQKLAEKKLNDFNAVAGRGIQQARDYVKYHR
jgi:hypothetical protein